MFTSGLIRLQAFTEGSDTIKILIGTTSGLHLHLEDNESCQVYYRMSGRKCRLNGHDWLAAESDSGTRVYLHNILPNQQYQVSVIYTTHAQIQFKQLFHFCSPEIFVPESKIKIFNNMPSNQTTTGATSDQDLLLIDCIATVLLKEAAVVIGKVTPSNFIHIERAIAEWGIGLLEKVVQNNELAAQKSLAVRAIIYSMLIALDNHQPTECLTDPEQTGFKTRLESVYGRIFKNGHKRSGKASHILRVVKHIARDVFQMDKDGVCNDHDPDLVIDSEKAVAVVDKPANVKECQKAKAFHHPASIEIYGIQFDQFNCYNETRAIADI